MGLSLSVKKLTKSQVMPLIRKIANNLPARKGKLLNRAGRFSLVNTVLSPIPTYHLTVFALRKWAIKIIDKIRRNFLWKGVEGAHGGHCQVNWQRVKRPKKHGGLGVLDLALFGRALRLRWLWYEWINPNRPWVGTALPCDALDRQLFRISTVVILGDGRDGHSSKIIQTCMAEE